MKLKKLCFAALPIAATMATLPIITSCQTNKIKTLNYYEAKQWVKNNIGVESKQYQITKSESNWSFGGFVTNYGSSPSQAATRVGWLYNHLDNMIAGFADLTNTSKTTTLRKEKMEFINNSEVDRVGATGGTGKELCKLGDIAFTTVSEGLTENLVLEGVYLSKSNIDTLSETKFDSILDGYFSGFYKHNADYIVDEKNKTITAYGTFSYIGEDDQGVHNIKFPNLKVTFNKEGKIINCSFDFDTMASGTYMWQSKDGSSSDGYSFAILPGSFLNFNFETKDTE